MQIDDAGLVPVRLQMREGVGCESVGEVDGRGGCCLYFAEEAIFSSMDGIKTNSPTPTGRLVHDHELPIISDKKPNTRATSPEKHLTLG